MSGCRRRVTARVLRADAPVLCGLLAEWRALIANMTVPELRVPPGGAEIERLFAGWREELATRRKFVPAARNYAAARLEAGVGLRLNEICMLDLDDVRWELGLVRQAERPPRQGSTTPRPQAAAGAADRRR
jgi:integrase